MVIRSLRGRHAHGDSSDLARLQKSSGASQGSNAIGPSKNWNRRESAVLHLEGTYVPVWQRDSRSLHHCLTRYSSSLQHLSRRTLPDKTR